MKDYASYSDWDPSKGDYVKSTLIEQRKQKKKTHKIIALLTGILTGIVLLIIALAFLHKALFG